MNVKRGLASWCDWPALLSDCRLWIGEAYKVNYHKLPRGFFPGSMNLGHEPWSVARGITNSRPMKNDKSALNVMVLEEAGGDSLLGILLNPAS